MVARARVVAVGVVANLLDPARSVLEVVETRCGWGWLGGCDDPGVDSTISYQLHHVGFIVLILTLR